MWASQLNNSQITTMIVTITKGITNSCRMKPTVGGWTGGNSPPNGFRTVSGGGDSAEYELLMLAFSHLGVRLCFLVFQR
jgi:hypothetical protein